MTLTDRINEVRDMLDAYARNKTDANLLRMLAATDRLAKAHEPTLRAALERLRLARERGVAR